MHTRSVVSWASGVEVGPRGAPREDRTHPRRARHPALWADDLGRAPHRCLRAGQTDREAADGWRAGPSGAGSAIPRRHRTHHQGFQAGLSQGGDGAEGRPEHPAHHDRRHGLRRVQHLRRPDSHADPRSRRQDRPALQRVPHHRPLLPDPGGAPHRPQPPERRHGQHHGVRHRLPGLHLDHAQECRHPRQHPRRQRLQHGLVRQASPGARVDAGTGRTLRPVGRRAGLRALLRIPRRRYGPVPPRALRAQPRDPASVRSPRLPPPPPPRRTAHYILIRDLAARSIEWLHTPPAAAPDKPFFLYLAPGNSHAPHHASKEWIAKFKGHYDQGWDKVREETLARQIELGIVPAGTLLTPRPKEIPAWDSLSDDQKKVYARMMEVYAGTVAQCDHEIGRVLDALEESGQLDDTLVIYIEGDNGASAEGTMQGTTNEISAQFAPESLEFLVSMMDELGSDRTYNHYPIGWAHAMDAPFQWTKQVASHFGGTRNGLVIRWPKRIKSGGAIRPQFHHVIDIVPTVLEAARIQAPKTLNGTAQKPIEGVSMVYTFDDAKAPTRRSTQYFEMTANRALYHDGWIASTTPARLPWQTLGLVPGPDEFGWELYHATEDFSQAHDVAKENPKKLQDLQALFLKEAARYNVLPLDSSFADRMDPSTRPNLLRGQTQFTYYPGMIRIPEANAADVHNRSFRINAEVEIPDGGAEGVLATAGGRFGGWALLVLNGKPIYAYALTNQDGDKYPKQRKDKTRIASTERLAPGKHTIAFDFTYDGGGIGKGGRGTLTVDGKKVGEARIEQTSPIGKYSLDESFDVGQDTGTPVIDEYEAKMPFKFSGALRKVEIQLGPPS